MARHHLDEPRVQKLIARLCDEFLLRGSVNSLLEALQEALNEGGSERQIYANRIHSLLSRQRVTVNTATLDVLETALNGLKVGADEELADSRRSEIRAVVASTPVEGADGLDRVGRAARSLGYPDAVVLKVVMEAGNESVLGLLGATGSTQSAPPNPEADWSFQDVAVADCLRSLEKGMDQKSGLVVPTAGGKTRIALRVALELLDRSPDDESIVLWVTHRKLLQQQARRALQELLHEGGEGVPHRAAELFGTRIEFRMIKGLSSALKDYQGRVALVIVDEAHHAATPSYAAIHDSPMCRALFLTATPNRMDGLPLGIDEIAYTISYKKLIEQGCIAKPVFDEVPVFEGLDWTHPDGLSDLADYLLDRTEGTLAKVLVVASRIEGVKNLYRSIINRHDEVLSHPLAAEDIGFCYGDTSSVQGTTSSEYFDEFAGRPSGILVATQQLVGEGFSDRGIDGVVITYPSESIGHLMQVGGRALRSAKGKQSAHIIQVRESALQYHFDERWLYQDISDRLRPNLLDYRYGSPEDLRGKVKRILDEHLVAEATQNRIMGAVLEHEIGQDLSMMLSGVGYFGPEEEFKESAGWTAILATQQERDRFLEVYNSISDLNSDILDPHDFLSGYVKQSSQAGSLWKSYMDLSQAMEAARAELENIDSPGQAHRPFRRGRATTCSVTSRGSMPLRSRRPLRSS